MSTISTSQPADPVRSAVVAAAFALVTVGILNAASLCDDAYITLRTVDNFVHGFGLRWNVDERVQTYTHPLWMLLLSSVYAVTREPYYTTLAVSLVATIASLVLLVRIAATPMHAAAALLVAGASHAFVTYSTSGLENPLSNVLLILYAGLLFRGSPSPRRVFQLSFLAALLLLNRDDYALLVGPSLAWETLSLRSRRALGLALCGMAPLIVWKIFSVVYYGSIVPNTAYAKITGEIPRLELLRSGGAWLWFTLSHDWLTVLVVVAQIAGASWQRHARGLLCSGGCLLYVGYIVYIGGDFMGGRFWLGPFVFALSYLAHLPSPIVRRALLVGLASTAFLPIRTTTFGGVASTPIGYTPIVWDDHAYYFSSMGLKVVGLHARGPLHAWGLDGQRDSGSQSVVVRAAVGMYGYYAGPRVHVVDELALTDPLLARLRPLPHVEGASGHLWRALPAGYVRSLQTGENVIAEPHLHEFFDHLSLVIRGPIWSWPRLLATVDLLLDRDRSLLRDYESSPAAATARANLVFVPTPTEAQTEPRP